MLQLSIFQRHRNSRHSIPAAILYLLFTTLAVSCGQQSPGNNQADENRITVLEGEWRSDCVDDVLTISGSESYNDVLVFLGNRLSNHVNEYSDNNCSVFLREVIAIPSWLPGVGTFTGTFAIGTAVTTRNGVDATELHFQLDRGFNFTDLFLLQNNTTTLILGERCPPPSIDPSCGFTDPDALNFSLPYTKYEQ